MKPLRHLLLALFLILGQLAVAAHALEHALGEKDGLPAHVCELCLAAHDLGGALPSAAQLHFQPPAPLQPAFEPASGRLFLLPPRAGQRGPPAA